MHIRNNFRRSLHSLCPLAYAHTATFFSLRHSRPPLPLALQPPDPLPHLSVHNPRRLIAASQTAAAGRDARPRPHFKVPRKAKSDKFTRARPPDPSALLAPNQEGPTGRGSSQNTKAHARHSLRLSTVTTQHTLMQVSSIYCILLAPSPPPAPPRFRRVGDVCGLWYAGMGIPSSCAW